ncbi:MAG: C45 family autoproteolytic acyltransferase/hydrolase [Planctomycetota bacterium]|jgi:predicted choloylglycine hydrolase
MSISTNAIEQVQIGGSHFEIGLATGKRFAAQIQRAFDMYPFLQQQILPYQRTPEGQARYRELLDLNRTRYPSYFAELEGMAEGAGHSFEELFLVNMRGEYRGFLYEYDENDIRGCSDCSLVTDETAIIGHNEDGSPAFRDNMYIVHARIAGKPEFTALSYPGFLCGNAFGFNSQGICFSVDNVLPRETKAGVGRHFIARSLLEACSLEDAIERVTVPGRASGFSYTIGSIPERRVVQVEVAPDSYRVQEIGGAKFHANQYQELADANQVIHPSSQARVERAGALMQQAQPVDAAGVLTILGDRSNPTYPIYRTATPPDHSATFCTALFDLDARQLRIYTDHPTRKPDVFMELAM